jgi:hypothetical protein
MNEPAESDYVVFVAPTSTTALPVGAELDYGKISDFFTRTKEDVAAEWEAMVSRLHEMMDRLSTDSGQFNLDEVQFELGFSAEGRLGLIAKAGATASITLKFTRRQT